MLRLVVGVAVLVVLFVALLIVIVGLTFSVKVSGHSMEPTLATGDRLEVDLLHRHDVHRFSVVEAVEPGPADAGGGQDIVKRVIGLPGDRIQVKGGGHPRVLIRPAGSTTTYQVVSTSWAAQVGSSTSACCSATGTSTPGPAWVTVPADSYWLIGDNWGGSTDSRVFGFVPMSGIKATIAFRLTPWSRKGHLPDPARLVPLK
jgi:signal peptidase I